MLKLSYGAFAPLDNYSQAAETRGIPCFRKDTEGLELSGDEECLEIRYEKTGIQV